MSQRDDSHMLRITATEGPERRLDLRVEGRIAGEAVATLRGAVADLEVEPGRIHIDLSGVSFIDDRGVRLIRGLRRRGAGVTGCSSFLHELLRCSATDGRAARSARKGV
jgi:anti-anti-sigma regulatory factor